MVSTSVIENGVKSEKALGLPPGDYHLIGWDVDTTGRRLIDEICQIAAYSPSSSFSQYVMPFRELNPAARRRHNIRVVTLGKFRMLKSLKTGKVLKTKCEISALVDFIQWLEKSVQGKSGDGVILVCHEPRKVAAPLLLEGLRRYNLLDKFSSIVKGFANSYSVAEVKCAKTVRSFSLRTLSRVLLDKEEELDSAAERARLSFQIVQHLCGGEDRQGSGDGSESCVGEAVREFTQTITQEEEDIAAVKMVLNRQITLRPVFANMLRRQWQRAINLRRILSEAGVDYEELTKTHQEKGNDGIEELITAKLVHAKPKEVADLKVLVQEHFNPQPKPPTSENKQKNKAAAKVNGEDVSGSSTPDTANSSPVKAPSSKIDDKGADLPHSKEPVSPSSISGKLEASTPTVPTTATTNNTSESVVAI